MLHIVRTVLLSVLLFIFFLSASVANAQETGIAPQAPVPSQLITAKKVFISNGGVDAIAFQAFRRLGNVHQPYDAFYSALSSWGKYTLVAAPAEADLVFEIRLPLLSTAVSMHRPICRNSISPSMTRKRALSSGQFLRRSAEPSGGKPSSKM